MASPLWGPVRAQQAHEHCLRRWPLHHEAGQPGSPTCRQRARASTVAGVAGTSGTTGDGGVATSALLNNPSIGPDGHWRVDHCGHVEPRCAAASRCRRPRRRRLRRARPQRPPVRALARGTSFVQRVQALQAARGTTGPRRRPRSATRATACRDGAGTGGFYFSDQTYHTVRRVFGNGTITTCRRPERLVRLCGRSLPALSSRLGAPTAVGVYGSGLLINSRSTCRIMMLWPNTTLTTAAGTGTRGSAGAESPLAHPGAGQQRLGRHRGRSAGPGGGWLFADQNNNVVRRVTDSGVIVRVAGTGTGACAGEQCWGGSDWWFWMSGTVLFDTLLCTTLRRGLAAYSDLEPILNGPCGVCPDGRQHLHRPHLTTTSYCRGLACRNHFHGGWGAPVRRGSQVRSGRGR